MLGEQLSITDLPLHSVRSLLTGVDGGRQEKAERVLAQQAVVLRPASTSQRSREELHGRCKNVSTSGFGEILVSPSSSTASSDRQANDPWNPNDPNSAPLAQARTPR